MIIEDCNKISSSEYKFDQMPEALQTLFNISKFAKLNNNWNVIQDFNWIKKEPSPNILYINE